ncbi:hypothetical protein N7532_003561 [Penicillium argentinense]|uniref:Zn(2)-C6 fungal-type domain-containing protein n=1 Tax=Penicillium argentinense TaxID=1131581 RepID=A0A9W9FMR7_9EURO|nr:uncharacterized protein N7532_003561 [Penicillium argentinense]KAJ5103032.1 hypothetical protein N7532_003561 [Penicillium argentinense]
MHQIKSPAGSGTSDDRSSEDSSSDRQQLQTVFRISLPGKKQKTFHARRAHKKSRGGCVTCKKRRVKCDEQKPLCQKCQNKGLVCSYTPELDLAHQKKISKALGVGDPTATFFSLSFEDVLNKVETALGFDSRPIPPKLISQSSGHPMSTIAFQHFMRCSLETVANPGIREVMGSDMNPHVMYTILAVGLLHLNRVSPNKERSYAEIYFWQRAIQLYQKELSTSVRADNVDALLSSCMMMGVMTICPENFKPTDSWVLTNKPERMNWLCLQSGLRIIITLAAPYIPNSIWASSFESIHKEELKIFEREYETGRDGLDSDLADLCGIDEYTTENNSVYHNPLRILTPLLKLEKNRPNAAHCATFMGRLECDFLALCRKREVPALVILAHWLGLMCTVAEWQPWIEGRIRGECIAICMFLETSTDPLVRRLLKFPAAACGYELSTSSG